MTTTEREPPKGADAATSDVVARLDALLALAADLVVLLDGDGTLQLAYPPGVLGYPVGQNIGRGVFDFLHPDDHAAAVAQFAEILQTPRGTVTQECRVQAVDGAWRWMELSGVNLLDDPTVCGVVVRGRDITEQKSAEDALEHGERRFKSLVQHASDLLIVFDSAGQLTYSSPATMRFVFGPGAENLVSGSRTPSYALHPDDLGIVTTRIAALHGQPRGSDRFRVRALRYDGEYRWLDVTVTNLLEDPNVRGIVANSRDVTDTVEFEEALRQSEARFRALVQNSSEIISVVDTDGTLLYASPAMEQVLGYRVDDIVGTNAADILHPDDAEVALDLFARVMEQPWGPVRTELRLRHADGSWRSIEIAATNRLDDPAINGIVVNNHDVTDRRGVEEGRRISERWFRGLVQRGNDIIVVADEEGRVSYVSPSIEHVLGYQPEDTVGDIGSMFLHPDDVPAMATFFGAVTSTPGFHAPIEMRAKHADGTWHWLEAVYTNQLDDEVINGIVMNFRDITERKEIEQQLSHQALHDALTGLPNRVLLVDRLTQAIARVGRGGSKVGVVFLDLDRFKLVNDTRGHVVGDALLAEVARRLTQATRASDTVARFGGDEFVAVYETTTTLELVALAERLCTSLAAPFDIEGEQVFVTASAGAVLGDATTEAANLLRDADAAMYHAKERGGGTVAVFDDWIGTRVHTRFETERAMRRALENDEFNLVYQPIVDLESGRIIGTEALLRWDHPELGEITPDDFIELAEETGLVTPIGLRILERACRQAVAWRELPGMDQLEMSVNVSGVQLRDREFARLVAETLEREQVDPHSLMLEITESFLVEHTEACLGTLAELAELGVCLALDDFGTRYSSLGYLHTIPVKALKIDRIFVERLGTDPGNTAIVSAIVGMATALDLSVISEGVETHEQREQLLQLGCRFGQGYCLARPTSADRVADLLRAGAVEIPGRQAD